MTDCPGSLRCFPIISTAACPPTSVRSWISTSPAAPSARPSSGRSAPRSPCCIRFEEKDLPEELRLRLRAFLDDHCRSAEPVPTDHAPKRPSESATEMVEVVLPNDANPMGFMLGGNVMRLIDLAGAIAAIRHSRTPMVTAAVDGLEFLNPVRVGDFIVLKSRVTATFTHVAGSGGAGVFGRRAVRRAPDDEPRAPDVRDAGARRRPRPGAAAAWWKPTKNGRCRKRAASDAHEHLARRSRASANSRFRRQRTQSKIKETSFLCVREECLRAVVSRRAIAKTGQTTKARTTQDRNLPRHKEKMFLFVPESGSFFVVFVIRILCGSEFVSSALELKGRLRVLCGEAVACSLAPRPSSRVRMRGLSCTMLLFRSMATRYRLRNL